MSSIYDPCAGASQLRRHLRIGVWILVALFAAGLAASFVNAVMKAREATNQTQCRGRMSQLTFALLQYHDVYGSFPPAYVADASGTPMHSWRVLILPFLDCNEFYRHYRFDEPWNGPHNSQLTLGNRSSMFHCASGTHHDDSHVTDYVVIVGPDTLFPGGKSTKKADIQDGPENTILLVEIRGSTIHWMEPRDLTTEEMSFQLNNRTKPSISGPPGPLGFQLRVQGLTPLGSPNSTLVGNVYFQISPTAPLRA